MDCPTPPRRVLAAVALAAALVGVPPARALDPARPLALYEIDAWRDGLPQYTVRTILQTGDGYVWAGTFEGLVRFDGLRFEVCDRSNVPAMRGVRIWSLAEQPRGTLWIAMHPGGLLRHRDGAFHAFTTADGLPDDMVNCVLASRTGGLWVGTRRGLARQDGDRFLSLAGHVPGEITAMAETRDGALLVGTSAGLVRWDGTRAEPVPFVEGSAPPVLALAAGRDGAIWIGTADGIVRGEGGAFTAMLEGAFVQSILEDSRGTVWAATLPTGLARFRNGRFETLGRDMGLPSDQLRSLAEDREGSLWIGSDRGIARLKDLKFVNWSTRQGLADDSVRVVAEAPDGSLRVGTAAGLSIVDAGGERVSSPPQETSPGGVRTLAWDPDGSLWVGWGAGLERWRGSHVTRFGAAQGLQGSKVDALYVPADGRLLVVTSEGGLQRLRDGRFEPVSVAGAGPLRDVRVLHEDRGGRLWLGTQEHGLLETRDGAVVKTRTTDDGLASDTVFALLEDHDGTLWIGTHDGVSRLRSGRLASLTRDQGLPEGAIFQVLDDGRGALWLTSNRGLFRVEREAVEAVLDGRAARLDVTVFGRVDGMGTDQCNGATQPAGTRLRDGRLAIPTAGGLTIVDPADLHRNLVPPPVVLERVLADGRPVEPGRLLPWSTRRLEFHFAGLSLLQPSRVAFRHRLDGVDEDWVDAGTQRMVSYNAVPPGRHTFHVQARNNDGVWSESEATFGFAMETPPWRRPWAVASWVALAALVIGGAVRLREGVLRRRNAALEARVADRTAELEAALARVAASEARAQEASRAKSVFLANMSHELRTPLNAVIGFAQVLGRDRRLAPHAGEAVRIIERSGEHLLGLINDVLSLSQIESGGFALAAAPFDLREMLDGVEAIVRPRSEAKELELRFEVEPDVPRYVSGDERKLRQVLLNLLGNAVKFTSRGDVVLRVRGTDGRVHFEVGDTGPGIAADEIGRLFRPFGQAEAGRRASEGTGLGLALSRQIVQLMGGDIGVRSRPGEGSTFFFDVALPPAETPPQPEPAARVVGLAEGQAPVRLLVVDDTPENRLLLVRVLEQAGFDVVEAGDGAQAVAAWQDARPDLVFMDVRMPVMDGRDATRRIRELEASLPDRPRTPIVALTASAFDHEREGLLACGMDDVLSKPFRIDELFGLLAARLGVRLRYETTPGEAGPVPLPEALPGIDVRDGLRRAGGDEALYRELVTDFLAEQGGLAARLETLRVTGGSAEAIEVLHAVRGTAGNLGLRALAAAAGDLERALRSPAASSSPKALARAVEQARRSWEPFVRARVTAEDDVLPTAGRARLALEVVARLERQLAANSFDAADTAEELRRVLAPGLAGPVGELVRRIGQLDYPAASAVLAGIAATLNELAASKAS